MLQNIVFPFILFIFIKRFYNMEISYMSYCDILLSIPTELQDLLKKQRPNFYILSKIKRGQYNTNDGQHVLKDCQIWVQQWEDVPCVVETREGRQYVNLLTSL